MSETPIMELREALEVVTDYGWSGNRPSSVFLNCASQADAERLYRAIDAAISALPPSPQDANG